MTTVILSKQSKIKLSKVFDPTLVKIIDRINNLVRGEFNLSCQDLVAFPEWEKLQGVFLPLFAEICGKNFVAFLKKYAKCGQLDRELLIYELALYLPLAYTKGEVFSDKLLVKAFLELNQAYNDLSKKMAQCHEPLDQEGLAIFHEKIQAYLQENLL